MEVIQQKDTMVRNIAERKRSVLLSGLREDNIRNWKKRKKREEKIRNLLNKMSEGDDVFSKVVDHMRKARHEI